MDKIAHQQTILEERLAVIKGMLEELRILPYEHNIWAKQQRMILEIEFRVIEKRLEKLSAFDMF